MFDQDSSTGLAAFAEGYGSRGDCRSLFSLLFQEETHAIEVDYGMTVVQRVHAENATDSRAALPQGETR